MMSKKLVGIIVKNVVCSLAGGVTSYMITSALLKNQTEKKKTKKAVVKDIEMDEVESAI